MANIGPIYGEAKCRQIKILHNWRIDWSTKKRISCNRFGKPRAEYSGLFGAERSSLLRTRNKFLREYSLACVLCSLLSTVVWLTANLDICQHAPTTSTLKPSKSMIKFKIIIKCIVVSIHTAMSYGTVNMVLRRVLYTPHNQRRQRCMLALWCWPLRSCVCVRVFDWMLSACIFNEIFIINQFQKLNSISGVLTKTTHGSLALASHSWFQNMSACERVCV